MAHKKIEYVSYTPQLGETVEEATARKNASILAPVPKIDRKKLNADIDASSLEGESEKSRQRRISKARKLVGKLAVRQERASRTRAIFSADTVPGVTPLFGNIPLYRSQLPSSDIPIGNFTELIDRAREKDRPVKAVRKQEGRIARWRRSRLEKKLAPHIGELSMTSSVPTNSDVIRPVENKPEGSWIPLNVRDNKGKTFTTHFYVPYGQNPQQIISSQLRERGKQWTVVPPSESSHSSKPTIENQKETLAQIQVEHSQRMEQLGLVEKFGAEVRYKIFDNFHPKAKGDFQDYLGQEYDEELKRSLNPESYTVCAPYRNPESTTYDVMYDKGQGSFWQLTIGSVEKNGDFAPALGYTESDLLNVVGMTQEIDNLRREQDGLPDFAPDWTFPENHPSA